MQACCTDDVVFSNPVFQNPDAALTRKMRSMLIWRRKGMEQIFASGNEPTQQPPLWPTYTHPNGRSAGPCSFDMSKVRSKDTKPELIVRKFLRAYGFRYRLHDKALPDKPDVVLPKYKTVIFVYDKISQLDA